MSAAVVTLELTIAHEGGATKLYRVTDRVPVLRPETEIVEAVRRGLVLSGVFKDWARFAEGEAVERGRWREDDHGRNLGKPAQGCAMNYYLIRVHEGLEPEVLGPYETADQRDDAAKRLGLELRENDRLLWATVAADRQLSVGSYGEDFFDPEAFE